MTVIHKSRGRDLTPRGEAPITTPNARGKLEVRGKPYYRLVQAGLHVGYRRNKNSAATWVARRALGNDKYVFQPLGIADDVGAPAGALAFHEAVRDAKAWFKIDSVTPASSITVFEAAIEYGVLRQEERKRQCGDFRRDNDFMSKVNRYVRDSALASVRLTGLTTEALQRWRAELRTAIALGRGKPLSPSSVERIVKDIRAALYHAADKHDLTQVASIIKKGLKSARGEARTNDRKPQLLKEHDIRAIVSAARAFDDEQNLGGDLYRLVLVMAATGMRFSQLQKLTVGDVDVEQRCLMVPGSFKGKKHPAPIPVFVDRNVIEALRPMLNGRVGSDYLLRRCELLNRSRWQSILAKAGLATSFVPYCFRHSAIVRMLEKGLSVLIVAQNFETSAAMIEQHYGRYARDLVQDLLRQAAISFDSAEVIPLRQVAG